MSDGANTRAYSGQIKKRNKLGMKAKENVYQGILWILLIVLAATMILPFVYVVLLSFTDSTAYTKEIGRASCRERVFATV